MDKKKHHKGDVYRRTESGRYVPIGYQWIGFPADGVWLVQNGKCNMTCLIGLKEKVPIFALPYRLHQQGIVDRIQAREKEVGHGLSLYEVVIIACDYFAHIAAMQADRGGEMNKVDVNSLSTLQAMKFFLTKERKRHQKDIELIDFDLKRLDHIVIPDEMDYEVWCEIAPSEGTNAPETSTQTTQMRGKNTQYKSRVE